MDKLDYENLMQTDPAVSGEIDFSTFFLKWDDVKMVPISGTWNGDIVQHPADDSHETGEKPSRFMVLTGFEITSLDGLSSKSQELYEGATKLCISQTAALRRGVQEGKIVKGGRYIFLYKSRKPLKNKPKLSFRQIDVWPAGGAPAAGGAAPKVEAKKPVREAGEPPKLTKQQEVEQIPDDADLPF